MKQWQSLRDILKAIEEKNHQLLSALEDLRQALMRRDVDIVETLIKEQDRLRHEIALLDQKRASICIEIGQHYLGRKELILSELIDYAPNDLLWELKGIEASLKQVLLRVKQEVRIMRYVLNTLLNYTRDMLDLYTNSSSVVYSSDGEKQNRKRSIFSGRA